MGGWRSVWRTMRAYPTLVKPRAGRVGAQPLGRWIANFLVRLAKPEGETKKKQVETKKKQNARKQKNKKSWWRKRKSETDRKWIQRLVSEVDQRLRATEEEQRIPVARRTLRKYFPNFPALKKICPALMEIHQFHNHLALQRGASQHTVDNYTRALTDFAIWHEKERHKPVDWRILERDDFRSYLRWLGRGRAGCPMGRSTIHLQFSALRSFHKFLVRKGDVPVSPIRNLALPKTEKRLPLFLTAEQMLDLLNAPLKVYEQVPEKKKRRDRAKGRNPEAPWLRDRAFLEVIYSSGLRISEVCGLLAQDIDVAKSVVRVRGKGRKERLVPINTPALAAIHNYLNALQAQPGPKAPEFQKNPPIKKPPQLSPRIVQKLNTYLSDFGADPLFSGNRRKIQPRSHRPRREFKSRRASV